MRVLGGGFRSAGDLSQWMGLRSRHRKLTTSMLLRHWNIYATYNIFIMLDVSEVGTS